MNDKKAAALVQARLETIVSRFEPMEKLDDEIYRNEVELCNPNLLKYMPSAAQARAVLVPAMDHAITSKVSDMFASVAGESGFACDGVTVNGRNCLLITELKGKYSRFSGLHRLGDKSHISDEEARVAATTILNTKAAYNEKAVQAETFVPVYVDNAAISMAQQLLANLKKVAARSIVIRDPGPHPSCALGPLVDPCHSSVPPLSCAPPSCAPPPRSLACAHQGIPSTCFLRTWREATGHCTCSWYQSRHWSNFSRETRYPHTDTDFLF